MGEQIQKNWTNALKSKEMAIAKPTEEVLSPPVIVPSVAPKPIPLGPRQITGFAFPKNICVGILKVDSRPPVSVVGEKPVDRTSKLTFYTRHASKDVVQLLDKFRDDDLNGLEAVFANPQDVIDRVVKWKRLEDLSFFDSLIKSLPGAEAHEETPIRDDLLPSVDKLTTLTSLGLCGPFVTGNGVAKMSLLRSLHTIKLKGIAQLDPLLMALAQHNNLEEVWLIGQNTDNHQLMLLTRMANLKSLTIRHSSLGPDSLQIFSKMKKLESLTLDKNNWSEADKTKFKKAIPHCHFEPVIDIQYWFLLPGKIPASLTSEITAEEKAAKPNSNEVQKADIHDEKAEFGLFHDMFQSKANKISISRVLVRPEVLEDMGATSKEINMISKYPFDMIRPYEKEFEKRLKVNLSDPTKWSHR